MTKLAGGGPERGRVALSVQPVAEQGGSDQALLRLAAQLVEAGWEVHVALPATSPMAGEYRAAGVQLHSVAMERISTSHGATTWASYALGWPLGVLALVRLARRTGADVVHSNSLHSWYGWAAARLARRPHIWHAREIVTQSGAALALERILARHFADVVVAVSDAVAAQLVPGNVVVVHEEADPVTYSPSRAGRARPRWGLEDGSPLVGYVGRIDTWKGLDVFVDAVPVLRRRRPDAVAVVAGGTVGGKEGFSDALRARAGEAGVRWLGPLTGPEAADLIADLDCLAYPSTSPEPWGLTIVEALACGTPVVSTDAGGPREIMAGIPAGAGRLVPPGDSAALAGAMAALLPARTSAEVRRQRPVLRSGPLPAYPALFEEVVAGRR